VEFLFSHTIAFTPFPSGIRDDPSPLTFLCPCIVCLKHIYFIWQSPGVIALMTDVSESWVVSGGGGSEAGELSDGSELQFHIDITHTVERSSRGRGLHAILGHLCMAVWRIARGPRRHVARALQGLGCAGIAAGILTFFPRPGKVLVGYHLGLPCSHLCIAYALLPLSDPCATYFKSHNNRT